jgi:hypothetical protein
MSSTETHGGPHDIRSKREFGGEEERVGISVLQVILFINALEKERFVRVLLTQSRQSQNGALMSCADSPKGVNFQPRWTSISKRHQRVSFSCEEHTCAVWSVKSNAPRALYLLFNFSFLLGGTPSERLRNAPVAFRTRLNASL